MGLLERALNYKKQLNEKGRETLIDRIKGPAESPFKQETYEKVDVKEFDDIITQDNTDDISEVHPGSISEENDIIHVTPIPVSEEPFKPEEEELVFSDEAPFLPDDKTVHNESGRIEEELIIIPEDKDDKTLTDMDVDESIHEKEPDEKIIKEAPVVSATDYIMPEFNDFSVLYEIQKELSEADTIEDIYKTILFSIMGQIGVSSASDRKSVV